MSSAPTPAPTQWVLRVRTGFVLDSPLAPEPGAHCWAGVVWPDARADGGWARHVWAPGPSGRGWYAAGVTPGDVIEFGADTRVRTRRRSEATQPRRWYGVVLATAPDHLVAHGPYSHPGEAWNAAQQALTAWRAAKHVPGIDTPAVLPVGPDLAPVDVRTTPGGTAVDDPTHGRLVVDADRYARALRLDRSQLLEILGAHPPRVSLTGGEQQVTLAALAAPHLAGDPEGCTFAGNDDGTIDLIDPTVGTRRLRPSRQWSPDGFSWGYLGGGPTETAHALIVETTGSPETARRLAPRYAADVISTIPQRQPWTMPASAVRHWLGTAVAAPTPQRSSAEVGL